MNANSSNSAIGTGSEPLLRREVGLFGATMMGLGSIVGTGVFVSIGIAAGIAGPAVIVAIALAAVVATCNALNSAQLAANHPVSGGTYEYGYKYLNPWLGFIAGWMFLCAKVASAATAALGFAGYSLAAVQADGRGALIPVAVAAVFVLTVLVLSGIRWSSHVNILIVSVTLFSLIAFCLAGTPAAISGGAEHLVPFFPSEGGAKGHAAAVLHAAALMFVAFTGYGRIATLGEEVREPRRTIPRAIILTLVVSALLYIAVGVIAIAAVGAATVSAATDSHAAPLQVVARRFGVAGIPWVVAAGAITAMLGVLLNLVLGLSRVVLAMARRGDLPRVFSQLNRTQTTPLFAVLLVGALIAGLACIGSVKTTWSFSAFTVLIYYAITNWAALRLPRGQRLYSRLYGYGGLAACLTLAFWVEPKIWLAGLGLIGVGLLWRLIARRLNGLKRAKSP
jgi:APA family basic amino acid/polyamine antiporter